MNSNVKKCKASAYRRMCMCLGMLLVVAGTATGCGSISAPDEYAYDDLSEYIKLGNYKGVHYDNSAAQVSQTELQNEIDELLSESASYKKIDSGVVENDSHINIDYVGSIDGVEFEGGAAEGVDFDIADNNYIDGFAEGIIGHKVGETFDMPVTFPDDYGDKDFAGKDAVFKITINYMQKETVPEYNDKWVKDNTDYDSMDALEEGLKKEILKNKKSSIEAEQRNEVFNKIVENSKILKYPEKEYQLRYDQLTDTYKSYAKNNNLDFAEYLSDEMGMTEKEFEDLADSTAKSAVEKELVIYAIAKAEGITASSADYQEYLEQILTDAGYTEKSYEDAKGYSIQEYAEANNLYTSLMYQRVMDKVMEYSKAK